MMSDECGMMNEEQAVFHSSFHHSALIISVILPILSIRVNYPSRLLMKG